MTSNEILKQIFGYDTFRLGQKAIIDEILDNRDAVGIMPTGAGKSICFQVPALMHGGITLVISPLISLMQDQVKSLNQAGVSAAYINSSLTQIQIERVFQYAMNGEYKILYVAPERLLTDRFLAFAMNTDITMLTVDEAHCISQWGQDFRPDYAKIPEFISQLSKRPIVSAFTATATEHVKEDIIRLLELRDPYVVVTGFDRANLYFETITSSNKTQDLLEFLKGREEQNGIIYCATRKNVKKVYEELQERGFQVAYYHAGLPQNVRQENQDDFQYDRIKIMVATNAFGMGIDKSNVNYVVHYNMPKNLESYYQEAGRAGRDGSPAHCIMLYSPQDMKTQQWMIEKGNDVIYENEELERTLKKRDYQRLKEMTFYATTNQCLRQYILQYFGEEAGNFCGQCGNCDTKFETVDITDTARAIIRCVEEMQGRYGKVLIVDVLRGSKTARVTQLGFDKLSSYGSSEMSVSRLRSVLDHLVRLGYLLQTDEQYSVIRLTEKSEELFIENMSLEMKVAQEKEKTRAKKKSSKTIGVSEERMDLYEKLRSLRSEIANNEHIPAFMVFTDATLIDICGKLPISLSQFANVSGVGKKKLEKYGAAFVEIVAEYCEENDIKVQEENSIDSEEEKSESKTKKSKASKQSKNTELVLPTKEMLDEIEISSDLVAISQLNGRINKVLGDYECTTTNAVKLGNWLVEQGYLQLEVIDGKNQKIPTDLGEAQGVVQEERTARGSTYQINLYPEEMQRYIVEHMEEILRG